MQDSQTATIPTPHRPRAQLLHKSFGLLNAGITSVDPTILQHMSEKVERLLNKENAIVQAPGQRTTPPSWSKVIPQLDHIMSPLQKMEKCVVVTAQAGKHETSVRTP